MNNRLRVLFLTLYPESAASPRYRVWQYIPYLREHGVDCTVRAPLTDAELAMLTGPDRRVRPFWYHLRETLRRVRQIMAARRYDVVFVQKALMTAYVKGLPELIRRRARRLVYDIDDAVHLAPPHPLSPPWNVIEDRGQITRLFARADLVLAGNAWLAQAARASNANTVLFPTVVDTDRFTPGAREHDVYRIGWIGSPSTSVCLAPAVEALNTVHKAEVCLVGADPQRAGVARALCKPWTLISELEDLRGFSLGIMPEPNTEWMRGKCALKALQYMSCGLPCVASPFGAALDIIRHMQNGLMADSTGDWLEAFESLRDPHLRQRIGDAGRECVCEKYSLYQAAPKLLELLHSVA